MQEKEHEGVEIHVMGGTIDGGGKWNQGRLVIGGNKAAAAEKKKNSDHRERGCNGGTKGKERKGKPVRKIRHTLQGDFLSREKREPKRGATSRSKLKRKKSATLKKAGGP